jgi:hypothetical protein
MLEKPSREKRDPEQAKKLRLLFDRVNAYGENDKASRKAIPRFKAQTNRTHRHAVAAELNRLHNLAVDELPDAVDGRIAAATFHGLHPSKRKVPDISNAIHVAHTKGVRPPVDARDHIHSGRWGLEEFRKLRDKGGKTK